jgi:peptidoglycan/xylan/chitin deacetylase (PgdA/CDA1 family)
MPDNRGSAPRRQPNVARRRLLVVAAGGVMVGIGVVGRGGGSQVSAASKAVAGPTGRAAATATAMASPAAASKPATTVTDDSAPAQPLYYVDDGTRVIALTIDDGPSPVYTPQVLAILEKYGVQATFSMIGKNVGYYPSVAREVAAAGHTIINHTWDHANLTSLAAPQQRTEIARATGTIHAATGVRPRMFRAPYGAWSKETLAYCASEQLTPLDWSVDPRDWARPGVKEIVNTIVKTTKSGSIILEHDGGGDRSQTVAALKIAIPRLIDQGYQFTIP